MKPKITKNTGATYFNNDKKALQPDRGGLSDAAYEQIVATKDSEIDDLTDNVADLTADVRDLTQAKEELEIANAALQAQAAKPEIVTTAAALTAKLVATNIGRIYQYTGETTADYTQNHLYQVIEGE